MGKKSVVTVANEEVSIVTVLQMLGVELPDDIGMGRSRKLHCPFGPLYHSDQGRSPAMRVYPETNSAWCFSCSQYFTPVKLGSQAWDVDAHTAATRLLDKVGIKPVDLAAAWAQAMEYEPEVDKALLADALKTYCRRTTANWEKRQFEPKVAGTLTRCLAILDLVRTDEDVREWLAHCKQAMDTALKCREPSLSERFEILSKAHEQQK